MSDFDRVTQALASLGLSGPEYGERMGDAIVKLADAVEKLVAIADAARWVAQQDTQRVYPLDMTDLHAALAALEAP